MGAGVLGLSLPREDEGCVRDTGQQLLSPAMLDSLQISADRDHDSVRVWRPAGPSRRSHFTSSSWWKDFRNHSPKHLILKEKEGVREGKGWPTVTTRFEGAPDRPPALEPTIHGSGSLFVKWAQLCLPSCHDSQSSAQSSLDEIYESQTRRKTVHYEVVLYLTPEFLPGCTDTSVKTLEAGSYSRWQTSKYCSFLLCLFKKKK